jgi:hypothetical protein
MKLFKFLGVLTFGLLLQTGRAEACSCVPAPGALEARADSDAVFAGRVISQRRVAEPDSYARIRVLFRVHRVWKGSMNRYRIIWTADNSATCGYGFQTGRSYMVYAQRERNTLNTNLCSRTKPWLEAAEDLRDLGRGRVVH